MRPVDCTLHALERPKTCPVSPAAPQADWEEQRRKGGITGVASKVESTGNGSGPQPDSESEDEDVQPMRMNSLTTEEWRAK